MLNEKRLFTNDKKIKNNKSVAITLLIIFASFVIFYTVAHPMYIYDKDDWYYSYFSRSIFPSTSEWNPTRILPETLMPAVSQLASFVIYPISKDYISSLSLVYAITYSFFIVLYVFALYKLLKNKFKINNWIIVSMLLIFVMLHLYPYNLNKTDNTYLLSSGNVTCYFYYMIPALLNLSVVMFLIALNMDSQVWFKSQSYLTKSLFILIIYLCINSSMFHSIILISYIGCLLLNHLIRTIKEKTCFVNFLTKNILNIAIIIIWLISIYLESRGGRASSPVASYIPHFIETLHALLSELFAANYLFWEIFIVINIAALIISIMKKDTKYINLIIAIGLSCLICTVYLVLLCDVVGTGYIQRTDVLITLYGFIIISIICSACKIIDTFRFASLSIPMIVFALMFSTVFDDLSYKNSIQTSYTPNEVKIIDDYIIEQVKEAVDNNKDFVSIEFPENELGGWPQNTKYAVRVTKALYYHGIVNKKIEATFRGVDITEITNK